MTPAARVQAAIELLDAIVAAARDGGPSADSLASAYFRERRYIGSKDRRAVRELAYAAIRRFGERPESGRAAMIGLAREDSALAALFDGSTYGPAPIAADDPVASGGVLPAWLLPRLYPEIDAAEQAALLDRAPLDIRFDPRRTSREVVASTWPEAEFLEALPYAAVLLAGTRVEESELWKSGAIEVQDRGSQAIVEACLGAEWWNGLAIDLCAGAGGKALGLAARIPETVRIIASDVSKPRLAALEPRRARAGADNIETLLLDPRREWDRLEPFAGQADLVLVDAPCSGTGTWRRNPETRWRLTPARLERLVEEQARLIALAQRLVRPGGTLVYAVCSLLVEEGRSQIERSLCENRGWPIVSGNMTLGRPLHTASGANAGIVLSPRHDGSDGFFLAVSKSSGAFTDEPRS